MTNALGRTFNSNVLVGNWFEDQRLDEVNICLNFDIFKVPFSLPLKSSYTLYFILISLSLVLGNSQRFPVEAGQWAIAFSAIWRTHKRTAPPGQT